MSNSDEQISEHLGEQATVAESESVDHQSTRKYAKVTAEMRKYICENNTRPAKELAVHLHMSERSVFRVLREKRINVVDNIMKVEEKEKRKRGAVPQFDRNLAIILLHNFWQKNANRTQQEFADELSEHGIDVSRHTVCRLLKEANLSKRRIVSTTIEEDNDNIQEAIDESERDDDNIQESIEERDNMQETTYERDYTDNVTEAVSETRTVKIEEDRA